MKKFVALLASCFIGLSLCNVSRADDNVVIIGYFTLEPHIYIGTDGAVRGSAVDYWEKHLAPEMSATVQWEGPLPYTRLLDMLETGDVHAGIILGKTPEREKILYYPDKPFYSAVPVLVFKQDYPLEVIRSAGDIINLRICYVAGGYLSPTMEDSRLTIENLTHSDWAEANFKKLVNDRCDSVFFPELNTARYYKNKLGLQGQVKELALPDKLSIFYTAFSKKSGKTWFTKYKQAREKIKKKISYSTISEQYAAAGNASPVKKHRCKRCF